MVINNLTLGELPFTGYGNLSGGAKERRKKSFKHHVSHQAPKNYYITTYQISNYNS